MKPIPDPETLEAALGRERAILYKHSTRCGLSTLARRQIEEFTEEFPGAEVFLVDVIADRDISDGIERRLGVRHESPQVILVERGKPRRHASHRGVRADVLIGWWEELGGAE